MKDYYQTLGVSREATTDDIKKSYRKLAAQHHPDRGGSTEQFQEIQEAYSVLSDPAQRARHDASTGTQDPFGGAGFNFESVFDMFNMRFNQPHVNRRTQMRLTLWLTIQDVFAGGRRPVSIGTAHGNIVAEIDIPAGIQDGETLHYPNIGPAGADIFVTFRHHLNPLWKVDGANVITEQQVGLWDCILGTQVMLRGLAGEPLTLTIPANTHPSSTLRLRGQGLPIRNGIGTRGDMFVKIKVVMPDKISEELLSVIKSERGS